MAAVTICSDFGAPSPQKTESLSLLSLFPFYLPWSDGIRYHDLCFFHVELQDSFFYSPLSPLSRGSLVPLCFSAIIVGSSAYLRLLIFLLAVLISTCDLSSLAYHMKYSAYELNKQGDNIQLCCTTFPILNQSVVPCPVLTVASWPAYKIFRRQVKWSGTPTSLRIFHSLLWSTQMI